MKKHNKFSRMLICSAISLACGGYVVTSQSSALQESSDLEYINPLLNYVSLYIDDNKLNEVSPSGHTVSNVLIKALCEYKEGEKPLYIDDVLIVNKEFGIPSTFGSNELTEEAKEAFNEMALEAKKIGLNLTAFSTYRDYNRQVVLYNNYVARDGVEAANRYSAKPGHSEHQSTLAYDIGGVDSSKWASFSFSDTEEAKWLAENAYKYGFILRYPENKEDVTGYRYESWHFRYVGKEMSARIFESNKSLEEFFALDKVKEVKSLLPIM